MTVTMKMTMTIMTISHNINNSDKYQNSHATFVLRLRSSGGRA